MNQSAYILVLLLGLFGVNWDAIDDRIAEEFPDVAFISAGQLRNLIQDSQDSSQSSVAVFDVRENEEFAVSHLPTADNLQTAAAIASQVPDKDAAIVVYCSVGYRSAGVAAELQQLGYSQVRNLHHAIFNWANNRLPMVNRQGVTDKVHPYNLIWGSLVEPSLRQYSP